MVFYLLTKCNLQFKKEKESLEVPPGQEQILLRKLTSLLYTLCRNLKDLE